MPLPLLTATGPARASRTTSNHDAVRAPFHGTGAACRQHSASRLPDTGTSLHLAGTVPTIALYSLTSPRQGSLRDGPALAASVRAGLFEAVQSAVEGCPDNSRITTGPVDAG